MVSVSSGSRHQVFTTSVIDSGAVTVSAMRVAKPV
jgi:hypothetical protein